MLRHSLLTLATVATASALPVNHIASTSGAVHTGVMTFNLDFSSNACDVPASGMVVAISAATFDPHSPTVGGIKNPNRNDLCGKTLQITHSATGTTTTATIVDRKASGSSEAIDVSPAVFDALGVNRDLGHCEVTWAEPGHP